MSTRGWFIIALLCCGAARAEVEDPTRAVDRVYFGAHGGVGQLAMRQFSDSSGVYASAVVSGPKWIAGFDTGYLLSDYISFNYSVEALDLSYGVIGDRVHYSGFGGRLSLCALLSLPLRYVAPHVGAGPAVLAPMFWDSNHDVSSPGPKLGIRYFGGATFLLTRDLKLFADVQFVPLDVELTRGETKTSPAVLQRYDDSFGRYLSVGVAYTPDALKEAVDPTGGIVPAIVVPTIVTAVLLGLAIGFSSD